jgi:AraC-like DNA-binding protein
VLLGLNKLAAMQASAFRLFFWPHRLLVLAPGFASAMHRHHAAQILVALDDSLEFRHAEADWQRAAGFIVPPDVPHAHRSTGPVAMLYLDAESSDWRASACCASVGGALLAWSPGASVLSAAVAAFRDGSAAAAADFCVAALGGQTSARTTLDPRIAAAQNFIATRLDRSIQLADIAREVHLSPSRLAHVFQHATGVPVRRYVLWCRLRAAAEAALQGRSLTDAAHEAGFADAAHLSRSFRAMFGIAPSVFTQNAAVVVPPLP